MPEQKKKLNAIDIAIRTHKLKREIAELTQEYEDNRSLLARYFDKTGKKSFTIDDNDEEFRVKKVETLYIKYDVEKLKERMDPDLFAEITTKTYIVDNMTMLKTFFKNQNIPAKTFKRWFRVDTQVDSKAINELFNLGSLSLEDLEGCYEATLKKRVDVE